MEKESAKYYHLVEGIEESHIYKLENRQIIFKNDILYLYKYFKEYGWFEVATTVDRQMAFYWLQTGELSRTSIYPFWEADYRSRQKD